jgi:putative ABC transport system ATP-binding protein
MEIMEIFDGLHRQGNTIILVTHENDIARHANHIIRLRDGRIECDEIVSHAPALTPEIATQQTAT